MTDKEPERYYDWMIWKMRQEDNATTTHKGIQPIETELMAVTAEECGEFTQSCMKVVRWGIDEDKRKMLTEEAGDVACMIDLLVEHGYITQEALDARKEVKRNKLKIYSSLINE